MISLLFRRVYSRLYYVNSLHEEREGIFIVVEYLLICVGLLTFGSDTVKVISEYGWQVLNGHYLMVHWHDVAELVVFVLLTATLIAREAIRQRRKRLGYDFRPVLSIRDARGHIDFGETLKQVEGAPWGYFPCKDLETEPDILSMADAVASASAGVLSERETQGKEDNVWFQRECYYLFNWFENFPEATWLIPTSKAEVGLAGVQPGYASVIVPITKISASSIKRGHRATDTAELDPDFLAHYRMGRLAATTGPGVTLLAYAQVCTAKVDNVNGLLLLTASLQHLSMLLYGRFGADGDFRSRWDFALLCESANAQQEQVLKGLGFRRLIISAMDKQRAHLYPARSFAGFPLMEFLVSEGRPQDGDGVIEAERLLRALAKIVQRYHLHNVRAIKEPAAEGAVAPDCLWDRQSERNSADDV